MKKVDTKQLTVRQKYLLDRIPAKYSIDGFQQPKESKEVKNARMMVDRFDKYAALMRCQHDKRVEALLRKAREAVYFSPEAKALAIIRQVEKMLKTCRI